MGLLGDIYSASDSLKRRVKGLFADPAGYMQQAAGLLSDEALKQAEINKRMVHNPETITRADTAGLLGTVMNFAPMGITKAAPMAKRLKDAERNAMEMLGLPAGNTAADRAAAMGYQDFYHGTERLDRLLEGKSINPKRATSGPMPFGTDGMDIASSYAMGKPDTSRLMNDTGNVANYFQVSPKSFGWRGTAPYSVEQSWNFLPREVKDDILSKATRVGYQNIDEATGPFVLHPEGIDATLSMDKWDWDMKNVYRGNPLSALRDMWHDSGTLIDNPESLGDIYKLAGYPHEVIQTNAPWYQANGVLTGMARISNPLDTSDVKTLSEKVIPALEDAFRRDRTRLKQYGADAWDKNTRYTPKEWVSALKEDVDAGKNSYVWTSIPDKVTEQLKALGYNGILDTGGKSGGAGHTVTIPFYPGQIRSRFAAFDPAKIGESDMLGQVNPELLPWLMGAGLLGGYGLKQSGE